MIYKKYCNKFKFLENKKIKKTAFFFKIKNTVRLFIFLYSFNLYNNYINFLFLNNGFFYDNLHFLKNSFIFFLKKINLKTIIYQ